jgi:hypothetical protein
LKPTDGRGEVEEARDEVVSRSVPAEQRKGKGRGRKEKEA